MPEFEHCQVLGPFNTGTVLMNSYVRQLFGASRQERFDYWKHSIPPHYQRNSDGQMIADETGGEFPGVLFICMVRSPYYWLPATSRRPYNLSFQERSFDMGQRLRSPVNLKVRDFKNLVQVWNDYYHSYASQLEPHGRAIYVRLEDLVRDPGAVLKRLDTRLERLPDRDEQAVIDSISKVPRKPDNAYGEVWEEKNRLAYAVRAIRQQDLAFINAQLDPDLMRKFEYPFAWARPEVA